MANEFIREIDQRHEIIRTELRFKDIYAMYGPTVLAVIQRKRALERYEYNKHMRSWGDKHLREAEGYALDLRLSIMFSCEYGMEMLHDDAKRTYGF
jgi:hypothetical protein